MYFEIVKFRKERKIYLLVMTIKLRHLQNMPYRRNYLQKFQMYSRSPNSIVDILNDLTYLGTTRIMIIPLRVVPHKVPSRHETLLDQLRFFFGIGKASRRVLLLADSRANLSSWLRVLVHATAHIDGRLVSGVPLL